MPEYLAPGVYVEEIDTGAKPIEGVSTSTTALLGVTERGPVTVPILVTSYGEYTRWFGERLDINVFSNDNGPHCYLPHAVEGFFTNGGKRAYITRVLDESAARAATQLFYLDPRTPSANTLLLRAARLGTGTAMNPPPLYVLDAANLGKTPLGENPWIRIGDGSTAEYRQLDVDPDTTNLTHVPLNFPLSRSHTAGTQVQQFARTPDKSFQLTTADGKNTRRGDQTITIIGAAEADLTALHGHLLEIGDQSGEYRFVTNQPQAQPISGGKFQANLVLDSGLQMPYASGVTVTSLTIPTPPPPPPPTTATLDSDASAGDRLIFLSNKPSTFNAGLVLIDSGNTDAQEVRRIGALALLKLSIPSDEDYPAGSTVELVALTDDMRKIADPTPSVGDLTVTVDDVTALSVGQHVQIGGANPESMVIGSITSLSGTKGRVTFTTQLTKTHAIGDPITPGAGKIVTDPTPSVGDISVTVDDVTALSGGQHVQVGPAGPTQESMVIGSIPPLSGTKGHVTFTTQLTKTHAIGDPITPGAGKIVADPTPSVGDLTVTVDDVTALSGGQHVQIGGANPESMVIGSITSLSGTKGYVTFTTQLTKTHAIGDPITYGAGKIVYEDHATPSVGDTTVTVDDVTPFLVGQHVRIGGAIPEPATLIISSIAPVSAISHKGRITFTTLLAQNHGLNDPVFLAARQLSAGANAGASLLALNNRFGLSIGDVLRVDVGSIEEYVTIKDIPNRVPGNVAPDAGNVLLTQRLLKAHAHNTLVWQEGIPTAPATPAPPTVTVLDTPSGSDTLLVSDGTNYTPGSNIVVHLTTPSGQMFYHDLTSKTTPQPALVTLRGNSLERVHGAGEVVVGRTPLLAVQAIDAGTWGDRLRISVEDEQPGLVPKTSLTAVIDLNHIHLASAAGVEHGTMLELFNPDTKATVGDPLKVESIDRTTNYTITLQGGGLSLTQKGTADAAIAARKPLGVRSREFRLTVQLLHQLDPALPSRDEIIIATEVFRNLSMDPRHSRYVQKVIGDINGTPRLDDGRPDGESWYIRVSDLANDQTTAESVRLGPETLVDILPSGRTRPARQALEGGDDAIGPIDYTTYIGVDDPDPLKRRGLQTFRYVDEISLVACPGLTDPFIQGALIDHCEQLRYRFAVLDGPPPPHDLLPDVQERRQQFDTKYAALYHPWLLIPDPFPTNLTTIADYPIPPSGHVLGIYARTDIERGVHKAPANEVVVGIQGLRHTLSKGEQEILNPYPSNINVIRDFRHDNRGIRVYGARVITSDPDWKYVNVRRLLIFIEDSLDRGLQWVVFEPNAEPLWARVRSAIASFLTVVWRNGALEGTTTDEAFFVKCDRTTMTQADIDNGRLICIVGVAPVKPAEFVIVRIGLFTAHAEA